MRNIKKPVIPREVAFAIEHCRENAGGISDKANGILARFGTDPISEDMVSPQRATLQRFASEHFYDYLCAVINGYEIEKSAEESRQAVHERIRDAYDRRIADGTFEHRGQTLISSRCLAFADGIKFTLNELGIKVEGVNA